MTTAEIVRLIRLKLAEAKGRGLAEVAIGEIDRDLAAVEAAIDKASAEERLESFRIVNRSGELALQAAILVNGGAAVALLAFMGHLATEPRSVTAASAFASALGLFVGGVAAGAIGTGARYVTQFFYHAEKRRPGHAFNFLSIALGGVSYAFFVAGGTSCYLLFSKMRL